jgi:hypothetical protein
MSANAQVEIRFKKTKQAAAASHGFGAVFWWIINIALTSN